MPFAEILLRPGRLGPDELRAVRDGLRRSIASELLAADPEHHVNEEMIDVRIADIGPYDLVRSDLFISVFARNEPSRKQAAATLVKVWAGVAAALSGIPDAVVELVLTDHVSSFNYSAIE